MREQSAVAGRWFGGAGSRGAVRFLAKGRGLPWESTLPQTYPQAEANICAGGVIFPVALSHNIP